MKLKVGDKVRVKNNLIKNEIYGSCIFVEEMKRYKDCVSKIVRIEGDNIYIELDNGHWYWNEEMLEKVNHEKKMSKCKIYEMPDYVKNEVKKVIINEPCVIVILSSGEKGVAKCMDCDEFKEERGFYIALERARREKCKNDIKRQDEIIKQYITMYDNLDKINDILSK